jgi:hypothetical protein
MIACASRTVHGGEPRRAGLVPWRVLAATALAFAVGSTVAAAGPVEVYRTGARFCPRDRNTQGPALTEAQAIERARSLLPGDFCGPTAFVSGCDVIPEYALHAWRIFFQQYKLRVQVHDEGGLDHSYVILDAFGNCDANIPGTREGATR